MCKGNDSSERNLLGKTSQELLLVLPDIALFKHKFCY